jgi:hypothetical protein
MYGILKQAKAELCQAQTQFGLAWLNYKSLISSYCIILD